MNTEQLVNEFNNNEAKISALAEVIRAERKGIHKLNKEKILIKRELRDSFNGTDKEYMVWLKANTEYC